tara:strand:- start:167 stop:439 length:273 start_codon:yes stop_codon:yes gene_type:complete
MGTTSSKANDLLKGGKKNSYGRKERRFMIKVLKESGIENPSSILVDEAITLMHLRHSLEDLVGQMQMGKLDAKTVIETLGSITDHYKEGS